MLLHAEKRHRPPLFTFRQNAPDGVIFLAENPGANALQLLFGSEMVAVGKASLFCVEDPFAHLITIEEEIGGMVLSIPHPLTLIRVAQRLCIDGTDVIGSDVRFLLFFI